MKRPTIKDMLEAGRLAPHAPDQLALASVIQSADRDLLAADANVDSFSPWADAMLLDQARIDVQTLIEVAKRAVHSLA